eukprot:RCo048607
MDSAATPSLLVPAHEASPAELCDFDWSVHTVASTDRVSMQGRAPAQAQAIAQLSLWCKSTVQPNALSSTTATGTPASAAAEGATAAVPQPKAVVALEFTRAELERFLGSLQEVVGSLPPP